MPWSDELARLESTPARRKAAGRGWRIDPPDTGTNPHAYGKKCDCRTHMTRFGCGCPCHGLGGTLRAERDGS